MPKFLVVDVTLWRIGMAILVVLVLLIALQVVGRVAGLPDGYGAAQSDSADELEVRGPAGQRELRQGAQRDLSRYIPGYVIAGVLVTVGVFLLRGARSEDMLLSAIVIGALLLAAAADVTETMLFRRSLTDLIGGATTDGIRQTVRWTRDFTALKFSLLLAALLHLGLLLFRP